MFSLHHLLPKIAFKIVFPIFLSIPALLIGIPVVREIFCFTCVIPKARFHEKERPGIGVDFFCAIFYCFKNKTRRLTNQFPACVDHKQDIQGGATHRG